jgi:hypothetical protein
VGFPYAGARGERERWIVEGEMDSRFEGRVDGFDAVCCEKHYTLEVFEGAEED